MSPSIDVSAYHNVLRSFLAEDLGAGDITTETVISSRQRARGEVIAKAPLVLAGIDLFVEVFRILDSTTEAQICRHDGGELKPGQIPARVKASARALLTGERVALNLLQRLSGVATLTQRFVQAVVGTGAEILDTRKTTPGLRALEKYAFRAAGSGASRQGPCRLDRNRSDQSGRIAGRAGIRTGCHLTRQHESPPGPPGRRASESPRSSAKDSHGSFRWNHSGERPGIRRSRRGLDFGGRGDAFRTGIGFEFRDRANVTPSL